MERVLGLDVGDKRVGLALSDPLGWTARPLPVLERVGWKKDLARILATIEEFGVGRIVVGLPIRMDGSKGARAEKALEFVEKLRKGTHIPVVTWDERLSTREAERRLLEADVKRMKRRNLVDGVAAALILQGYLDSKSGGFSP